MRTLFILVLAVAAAVLVGSQAVAAKPPKPAKAKGKVVASATGIHIAPDDLQGRKIGSACGKGAWTLARHYFDGTARA